MAFCPPGLAIFLEISGISVALVPDIALKWNVRN
jgi:hypothetical protein